MPSVPLVQMNLILVDLGLPFLHLPIQSLPAHSAFPLCLFFLQSFAYLVTFDAGSQRVKNMDG